MRPIAHQSAPSEDAKKELIARARAMADRLANELSPVNESLRTRCPGCQSQVVVQNDTPWTQLCCETCSCVFSLIGADESDGLPGNGQLGQFQLLERIGTGGFGSVWKAHDQRLDRFVAIKIPHDRRISISDATWFLREAQAAARLQHPNIVAIHEVGRDRETIFIVYELIQGISLADWMEKNRMPFRDAAALCRQIAIGLDYAHQMGVVHRDLKPANILVRAATNEPSASVRDGEPHRCESNSLDPVCEQTLIPYLTDFGLATRRCAEITVTRDGLIVGTPAYMSPEQAAGREEIVDHRSDVYSLGVILFELLTGELPFRGTVPVIVDQVLREDPPSPRRLNHSIPRDLETICLKAVSRKPSMRYRSAGEMGEDLQRFLNRETIQARPLRWPGRTWRWCRRKPLAASLVALILLIAGIAPCIALREHRLGTRESLARSAAIQSDLRARQMAYAFGMNSVQQSVSDENYPRASSILRRYLVKSDDHDLRSFPWQFWWRVVHHGLVQKWTCSIRPIDVACNQDGRLIAFCDRRGQIAVWNLVENRLQQTLSIGEANAQAVAISDQGGLIAAASTSDGDVSIHLFNLENGAAVDPLLGHQQAIRGLDFSPDGRYLASAGYDGLVKVWEVDTGRCIQTLHGHYGVACCVRFSHDQQRLYTGGGNNPPVVDSDANEVIAWDWSSGNLLARKSNFHVSVTQIDIAPDDAWIVAAGMANAPVVLKANDLSEQIKLQTCKGVVYAVATDAQVVVGAGSHGLIWSWDVHTGELVQTWPGHSDIVFALAMPPDCDDVISASADSTVARWRKNHLVGDTRSINSITDKPAAGQLLGQFEQMSGKMVRLDWSDTKQALVLQSAETVLQIDRSGCLLDAIQSEPSQRKVLLDGVSDGGILVWPDGPATHPNPVLVLGDDQQRVELQIGETQPVSRAIISPDQRYVAIGTGNVRNSMSDPVQVLICDRHSGRVISRIEGHHRLISGLAFAPDSQSLAVASGDRKVAIWEVPSGGRIRSFDALFDQSMMFFTELKYSPDGQTLLGSNRQGEICFWDTRDWSYEFRIQRGFEAQAIDFTADGNIAAVVFSPRTDSPDPQAMAEIALWDLSTRELATRLKSESKSLSAIAFVPGEPQLFGLAADGKLYRWSGATEEEVAKLLANEFSRLSD